MPDRAIDRWTIAGEPGRWIVQHLPNRGYGLETYESDLDEVPEVVGNDAEMNSPRRRAINEFLVADDQDASLLAQMLIPDATGGAEDYREWPEDVAGWWMDTAPEIADGLPWVDRWVSINGRRLSAIWAGGDTVLAPCNASLDDLHTMVNAMREGAAYVLPWSREQ